MSNSSGEALLRASTGLESMAQADGRFEGRLTSNTYPTLACMIVALARDGSGGLEGLRWLHQRQLDDGRFALDAENLPSDEATRFARVVLHSSRAEDEREAAVDMLGRLPELGWSLWLVKVLGAVMGQYPWEGVRPGKMMELVARLILRVLPAIPSRVAARLRPPDHVAPPVSLFYTPAFSRMFLAEQYTIAPMLLLIEAHTRRRHKVLDDLTTWILSRQASDGSWFCVTFITAIAVLALQVAAPLVPNCRTQRPLALANQWLVRTRNPDGGHREAVSLNVWDTALAMRALLDSGVERRSDTIANASTWLVAAQNHDGGWAFHGVRGNALPADADDTALAVGALLRSGRGDVAVGGGLAWLRDQQARDGSWSTYVPGRGDAGCVSVTAHAVETMLTAGDRAAADRAVNWLAGAQAGDGSWEDIWLARRTYGTASALVAFARADRRDSSAAHRGLEWIEQAQNDDGGWGEMQSGEPAASTAEQTGVCVQALAAHGRNAADGIDWLLRHQRDDGGWRASPIGIYWEVIGGYANPVNAWVFPMFALNEVTST